jgi:predicted O-linked N-acetylglucosamine transferase (SPINDLY family)
MGVPVVTKLGNSPRIGGAIMSAIDMSDWIARDDDEYVDIALRSAPERLSAIRETLPELVAVRCGPAAYTRAAKAAYRVMWERYCGGRGGLASTTVSSRGTEARVARASFA